MIGPSDLLHPSPAPHIKTFQVFLICCPKRPSFSTIQNQLHHGEEKNVGVSKIQICTFVTILLLQTDAHNYKIIGMFSSFLHRVPHTRTTG
jgi:hypothetical protein